MSLNTLREAVNGLDAARAAADEAARPVSLSAAADPMSAPTKVVALDVASQSPVETTPEDYQKGLLSGRYSVDPTSSTQVVDAEGTPSVVQGRELLRALDRGYVVDSAARASQRIEHARISGIEQEESASPWKTFGKTLANEALLGIPEHLLSDEDRERFQIGQRVNPFASGAAKAAGYAADVALAVGTGGTSAAVEGAGKLATKAAPKLAARIAEGAAKKEIGASLAKAAAAGAVESAVIDAPRAVVESALGDPEDAAEALTLSMGLGAAVSGLLGGAGAVASKVGRSILSKATGTAVGGVDDVGRAVADLSNLEASKLAGGKQVAESVGLTPKEHGTFLRDQGLIRKVGESDGDYITRIRTVGTQQAEAARAPLVQLDAALPREARPTYDDVLRKASGKERGDLAHALDDAIVDEKDVVRPDGRIVKERYLSLSSMAQAQEDLLKQAASLPKKQGELMRQAAQHLDEAMSQSVDPAVTAARREALKAADTATRSADALQKLVESGKNRTLVGDVFDLLGRAKGIGKIGIAGYINPALMLPAAAKHVFDRAGGVEAMRVALAARGASTKGLSKEALGQLAKEVYGGSSVLALADGAITHGQRLLTSGMPEATRAGATAATAGLAGLLSSSSRDPRRRAIEIGDRITAASEAMSAGAELPTTTLLGTDAPNVSAAHQQHVKRSLQWLSNRAPRITKDAIDGDVLPSRSDSMRYEREVKAALDPQAAASSLVRGRAIKEELDVLQALYPRQLARLQSDVLQKKHATNAARRGAAMTLTADRAMRQQRREFYMKLNSWGQEPQAPEQKQAAGGVPPSPPRSSAEMSPADRTALRGQLG